MVTSSNSHGQTERIMMILGQMGEPVDSGKMARADDEIVAFVLSVGC